jgi:hypothetical protein
MSLTTFSIFNCAYEKFILHVWIFLSYSATKQIRQGGSIMGKDKDVKKDTKKKPGKTLKEKKDAKKLKKNEKV